MRECLRRSRRARSVPRSNALQSAIELGSHTVREPHAEVARLGRLRDLLDGLERVESRDRGSVRRAATPRPRHRRPRRSRARAAGRDPRSGARPRTRRPRRARCARARRRRRCRRRARRCATPRLPSAPGRSGSQIRTTRRASVGRETRRSRLACRQRTTTSPVVTRRSQNRQRRVVRLATIRRLLGGRGARTARDLRRHLRSRSCRSPGRGARRARRAPPRSHRCSSSPVIPWQKRGLVVASAADRFDMVQAAVEPVDGLEASRSRWNVKARPTRSKRSRNFVAGA